MSTVYPTNLQDLDASRGVSGNPLSSPNHITHHTTEDDTIEALQAKVGIDGSVVTSSIDYKLTNASSSNPGHKHTLANGATDVTATATEVNYTDGVTSAIQTQFDNITGTLLPAKTDKATLTTKGDIYAATAASTPARLAVGSNNQVLTADSSTATGLKWAAGSPATDIQTFTGNGTWTKPTDALSVMVQAWGGGGGSGGCPAASAQPSAGGGGGGYKMHVFRASDLGATVSVTVGAAGAAGSSGGGTGGNGGTSSFGSHLTIAGGTGGAGGSGGTISGGNGAAYGLLANDQGAGGSGTSTGGAANYGGGGGGGCDAATDIGGIGGASMYGGGGGGGSTNNVSANSTGGAGAAGVVRILELCTQ